jgi:hypothetical protein
LVGASLFIGGRTESFNPRLDRRGMSQGEQVKGGFCAPLRCQSKSAIKEGQSKEIQTILVPTSDGRAENKINKTTILHHLHHYHHPSIIMRATPVLQILTKELLSKTGKKGRLQAVTLLNKLAHVGKLPEPYYEYRPGGYAKKRLHYFKLRFRVPQFLMEQMKDLMDTSVIGAGRCRQKPFSKTLAALEVVHQLEEGLGVARGGLQAKLDDYLAQEEKKQQELEKIPVDTSVPNVTWFNLPMDPAFPESQPATRRGRIDFFPRLKNDAMGFMAAKASTLTAETKLPSLVHQANQADDGVTQKWANLKVGGRIKGWANAMGPDSVMGMDAQDAEYICFSSMAESIVKKSQQVELEDIISAALGPSSFGMAKLFVAWPKHHYEPVKELLTKLDEKRALVPESSDEDTRPGRWDKPHGGGGAGLSADRDKALLKPRLDSFRRHQRLTPLPIDSVEANIPHQAEVVVVRGGTGSGTLIYLLRRLYTKCKSCRGTKCTLVEKQETADTATAV